jgi:hypothetical protein
MVFALNAIGLAVWFPRIPDVKEALELDTCLALVVCASLAALLPIWLVWLALEYAGPLLDGMVALFEAFAVAIGAVPA